MLRFGIFRTLLLFSACLVLVACGSGGGGGNDSSDLEVSASSVTFTSFPYAPLPPTQSVNVSWNNPNVAGVIIGYPPDVVPPDWLEVNVYGDSSPATLTLSINSTDLPSGTYTTTLRVVSVDTDYNPLDIRDIAVTLILTDKLILSGNPDLSFSMIYGGFAPQVQSINLVGDGIDWTASASADWVQLSEQTGTAPSSISLGVDPAGLSPGVHEAIVEFADDASDDVVTVNVQFTIEPNHLAINGSSEFSFAMVNGGNLPQDQTLELIGDGVEWTAVPSATWVQLSEEAGTAPSSLSLGVDPTGLEPGVHTATIDFVDDFLDEVVTLNVQVSIEPHRLFVSDNGVALASMPNLMQLSYSVGVSENAVISTPWTASSDQAWLSVTSAGNTGEPLVLTADPAGLSADTIHYATVTVSSSDPSIEGPDLIRVGLWVGSSDPNEIDNLVLAYTEIAADPIRPLVYMHDGGTSIDVYNVHTAQYVKTIADVGAQLGDMEFSSDGSTLYAVDLTNFDIVPIDLDTDEVDLPRNLSGSGNLWLAYGRNQGKPLIFASSGSILDADTGSEFSNVFSVGDSYYQGSVPNMSQNGEIVCGLKVGLSPYTIECYEVEYSELNGGALTLSSLGAVRGPGGNAKDLALTRDGSRVYVASGAPYEFVGFDTSTMEQVQTLPADAYPNNVEIGSDELLYGGIFSWYGPTDLWVYSLTGVKLADYYLSGYAEEIRDRQLVVSGDGLRIILSTTDPKITMLNSP